MFASNTLTEHILRGAIGIAALGYAPGNCRNPSLGFARVGDAGAAGVSRLPDLLDDRPVRNRKAAMAPGGRLAIVESGRFEHLTAPIAAVRVKSMLQKSLTEQRDAASPLFRWRAGG